MAWFMALGLAATWGCSSSRTAAPGVMAMHCSKCNVDMKSDMTLKCKCGNDVQVGELKAKCPKCNAEVKVADCIGACSLCGTSMRQSTCRVKCPKCSGEADARELCCPHCAGDPKK